MVIITPSAQSHRRMARMKNTNSKSVVTCMIGVLTLALTYAPVGWCQTLSGQDDISASSESVEEIVVYGEKNLVRLRVDYEHATESFWDTFNELNIDDQFDVECEHVTHLDSYRRYYECKPRFQEKLEIRATQDMILSGNFYDYRIESRLLKNKKVLMEQEVTRLLSERPEIQTRAEILQRTKDAYEFEQARRRYKGDAE